jgi:hypothetical protein
VIARAREPRTTGKAKEMSVRFGTELGLAFVISDPKFIAVLAFYVPSMGAGP